MTRVKIKCRGTPDRDRKRKLLEILCSHEVRVTRVFHANDGFTVLALNEEYGDKIFSNDVKSRLVEGGFTPMMPAELRVKKSVILTRVDDAIYEWGTDEIFEELKEKNTWIGEDLDTIYKFPNSNTLKLTFTQTQLAKKCTEAGIRAFGISIPPHEIRQESFIPILCCMRCYRLEAHNTRDCPKGSDFKICSECSIEGHMWYEFKSGAKKCINCDEEHSTLAMKCPKRKMILKEKRKEDIERQKMSYADI